MASLLTSLFLLCLSSSTYCSSAVSNLTSSKPLSLKQTLVSSNQVFELGFFNPTNSSNQYLGIWYKGDSSPHSVVWVANREDPLSLTDTWALLQISISNGNLELLNGTPQNSSVLWSTKVDLSSNSTLAILLDNGNFVLRDSTSGADLWQSFQHPCDTFLPSSVLGFNLKTGENYKLNSWKAENDPSPGNFTFGIAKKTPPEAAIWFGAAIYTRSGPWDKLKFTGIPDMASSCSVEGVALAGRNGFDHAQRQGWLLGLSQNQWKSGIKGIGVEGVFRQTELVCQKKSSNNVSENGPRDEFAKIGKTPLFESSGDDLFFRLAHSELQGGGHLSKTKIIIGLVVAVSAGAALLAVVAFGLHRRKAKRKSKNNIYLSFNL
ncbi:G-type lectin S-receptor-like serine/threonine-protein kinase At1g61480 [Humulus lupulus]|uniref:G-type lectin S-receptor-like serine/threonine-protein kinase At1g61480 n=1 Tax=Humulus lupulus TaxID=3486 RepID=UPI002B40B5A8|nr:G-type lectin S-receptor-like serine/threonine-protein kinase At1g61480 [Humulus lupulus]